jgi:hypothetical protein
MNKQRPARKGFANGILGERITAGSEYQGSLIKAACRQWDIRGDDNIIHRDMLSNPVIGGVELPFDNHKVDRAQIRDSNPRVGDHRNMEPISLRNPVHLLLNGAAIGIDEYFKHFCPLRILELAGISCGPILSIESLALVCRNPHPPRTDRRQSRLVRLLGLLP